MSALIKKGFTKIYVSNDETKFKLTKSLTNKTTKQKNGVLIIVDIDSHKFSIDKQVELATEYYTNLK